AGASAGRVGGGKPLPPFKYFDKGELAVIGRAAAVANIFGRHISGLPAWLVWVFVHLMYLVQSRSRITVFIEWAIEDLTFSRRARLITGPALTVIAFTVGGGGGARGGGARCWAGYEMRRGFWDSLLRPAKWPGVGLPAGGYALRSGSSPSRARYGDLPGEPLPWLRRHWGG